MKLNSDDEMRSLVSYFRQDRREIFADDQDIDLIAYSDHCDFLMQEVDDLKKAKLKDDFKKYTSAMSLFDECLSMNDHERLLESVPLEIPIFLTEERANQMMVELIEYEESMLSKFSVKAKKSKKNKQIVRFRA